MGNNCPPGPFLSRSCGFSTSAAPRQISDHPREDCGPLSLGQIHAGHEDHSAGDYGDPIGRNRVAFRVAVGRDSSISRAGKNLS